MEFKENLVLNEEEKEKLEWIINWYSEYWERLKSYGIDTHEDLFYIIVSVLKENEKNS